MMHLAILLICAHALCDFPLQGDFLSKGKNPFAPLPGVPWFWCMLAHCLLHAGAVYLITGRAVFAVTELVVHFAIDVAKCRGAFGFTVDQLLHYLCKWWYLFALFVFLGVR